MDIIKKQGPNGGLFPVSEVKDMSLPAAVRGHLYIVQGPSPSGKTTWLKDFISRVPTEQAAIFTSESIRSYLIETLRHMDVGLGPDVSDVMARPLAATFRRVVIDDIDRLSTRQLHQQVVAEVICQLCEAGLEVAITGICLEQRLAELWPTVHSRLGAAITGVELERLPNHGLAMRLPEKL